MNPKYETFPYHISPDILGFADFVKDSVLIFGSAKIWNPTMQSVSRMVNFLHPDPTNGKKVYLSSNLWST